jgi:hypothetical protein
VSIGNFGPPGSKHWDIIGNAVIEAKRMESTAPIGGLRISESFYKALDENGIVDQYYQNFLAEAKKLDGYFKNITKEELFQYGSVLLKDKRNVSFLTYSVQVNPDLPESIVEQISLLLAKGETGADRIVDLIKYYRGNKNVIDAIEDLCAARNIRLRKGKLICYLFREKFQLSLRIMGGDKAKVEEALGEKRRLFDVLKTLGEHQDKLKLAFIGEEPVVFENYDQYMDAQLKVIGTIYKRSIKNSIHNTYFFNVIFPLIFKCIKASILEYQSALRQKTVETKAMQDIPAGAGAAAQVAAAEENGVVEDLEDLEEVEPA